MGSQKDGEGNLVDWWEPETKARYLEKARCIIEQYGNYTVEVDGETLNVNGINSQGENIADNGGVKEALLAYNRLTERHGGAHPSRDELQPSSTILAFKCQSLV